MPSFSGIFQIYSVNVTDWKGKPVWNFVGVCKPGFTSDGFQIPLTGETFDAFELRYLPPHNNKMEPPVPGEIVAIEGLLTSYVAASTRGGLYMKPILRVERMGRFGSQPVKLDMNQHVAAAGSNKVEQR
jgi:hypothetical protein